MSVYKQGSNQSKKNKPKAGVEVTDTVVLVNGATAAIPEGDKSEEKKKEKKLNRLSPFKATAIGTGLTLLAGLPVGAVVAVKTEPDDFKQKTTMPEPLYNRQLPKFPVEIDPNGTVISSEKDTKPNAEEMRAIEADNGRYRNRSAAISKEQTRKLVTTGEVAGAMAVAGGGIGFAVNRYLEGRQRERDEAEKGGKGA